MQQIRVVLTAAVTWLTVAGTIAAILVDELAGFPTVANVAARAVVVLATATAIIRRVTPVLPDDRGVTAPHSTP